MMAVHANGASEDVTAQAAWASSDATVLRVTGGRVDAISDGVALVSAQYNSLRATKTVNVTEPGTFSVTGSVSDGSAGLNAARVDVVSGTGTGRFATTTSAGGFRIFGLAGLVELKASADGYVSRSQTLNVNANTNASFTLTPVVPPADVSGAWQLTIDASPSCSALPDVARRRIYTAAITQNVAGLRFVLGGASFQPDPAYGGGENIFYGRITESTVNVTLASYQYYGLHYDLAELLPEGAGIYTAVGTGTGSLNGSTIAITLAATLTVSGAGSGACAASDHRMTLVRTSAATARR
jgi:hypothetical protein